MAAKKKASSSDHDERRRTKRTIVRESFNLFLVIPELHGMSRIYLRDISAGGLCYRTEVESKMKPGQNFQGRIYLSPGFYIPVDASVVRSGGGETAVSFADPDSPAAQAILKLQGFFEAAEEAGVVEE
jgi:hypothetical protein